MLKKILKLIWMYLNFFLRFLEFKFYYLNKNTKVRKNNFYFVLDHSSFTSNYDITRYIIYLGIKSKYKNVKILIIPPLKLFDATYNKEKNIEFINYFRSINIVYPIFHLVKNFNPEIIFFNSREEAYNYLGSNDSKLLTNFKKSLERKLIFEKLIFKYYNKHKNIPKLEAHKVHKDVIEKKFSKYIKNKQLVTITLKHSSYYSDENSNLEAWNKISKIFEKNNFKVVVIRDFEQVISSQNSDFNDLEKNSFDLAVTDPNLRLALYEKSILNLGVSMGPFNSFIFFSKANFLCFKTKNLKKLDYKRRYGVYDQKINFQFPFFSIRQKIVYKEDNFQSICEEIKVFFENNNIKINF